GSCVAGGSRPRLLNPPNPNPNPNPYPSYFGYGFGLGFGIGEIQSGFTLSALPGIFCTAGRPVARRQGSDRLLSRHLAVPVFLAVAGENGPADALPALRARHWLVAAEPDRHDGHLLFHLFAGLRRRRH